ncbi:MAG: DNA adenine methylase [Alphaproteobacteria bacterium]
MAKPFLKWAGGKTQLIGDISCKLPTFLSEEPFTYIEPFIGGGAFFFWLANNFPNMERAVINDINKDLINCYQIIRYDVHALIEQLQIFEVQYNEQIKNEEEKKEYYYAKREMFNNGDLDIINSAAHFIFLNRTCFNGLYRVNKSGKFNVPMGRYKKPTICDKKNLLNVSRLLQKVEILSGDYERTLEYADDLSFYYLDPPYKPLSETSNFNSYSSESFDDNEQIRLKRFCDDIVALNGFWILSNSDVQQNSGDLFFDKLYKNYEVFRVEATRKINSLSTGRGALKELLISSAN